MSSRRHQEFGVGSFAGHNGVLGSALSNVSCPSERMTASPEVETEGRGGATTILPGAVADESGIGLVTARSLLVAMRDDRLRRP
jgi:hypothetical protein